MNDNTIQIQKATLDDIQDLHRFCKKIYTIYFGDYWNDNGLELYLKEQFGRERLRLDLANPLVDYFYILFNNKIAGFLKINNKVTFERFDESTTSELEKMYVLPEFKGKGIGKKAFHGIIKTIKQKGKQLLFLEVLDTNKDAIKFYEKVGFKFHSNTRLKYNLFKEELKGLNYMYLQVT